MGRLAGSYASTVDRFVELLGDPARAQAETAARLLGQLARGRFGREHGLDAGGDPIELLRRRVPLRNFEGLRPFIEPAPADLSGDVPLCLLRTSASTGKPKLIPYTTAFRDSIKRAHDVFSAAMFRDTPGLPLVAGERPRALGLYQLSTTRESLLGHEVDSYVSRLYDVALAEDPFFFALDKALCAIPQARERLFAMALAGASWDLLALRATNPTTLLLFARVLAEETEGMCKALHERGDDSLATRLSALGRPIAPRDLWPNLTLLVTWRGGTCHMFEPHLRAAYGEVRIRAPIFAASEGVVAIPLHDTDLGGAPAIESTFFEFLPEPFEGEDTLLLHELVDDRRYELVISSPTGMTRYRIGDLVQVDGRIGQTPTFHFLARKGRTSSLTGEKLTELQVEEAVSVVAGELGAQPVHFLLSAHFDALPFYVLSIDFGDAIDASRAARFAARVDEELQRRNIEYEAKRSSSRLGPVKLRCVRTGEFERLQAGGLSGGGAVNFKLAHLSSEPVHQHLLEAS